MPDHLPIAIIGAGPVGLAAAAHLLTHGETPVIFEAGDAVGQSIRAWAHVCVFSPWGLNVGRASAALLAAAGWTHPAKDVDQLIDPNLHSCGTVRPHGAMELAHPEAGFFIVGMKSYGRAPTFLLATGYEQVRSVVASLTGDIEAARRVELQLPETGVCSTPPHGSPVLHSLSVLQAASCCGGPAPADSDACCAQDAAAKATGQAGCGCGATDIRATKG